MAYLAASIISIAMAITIFLTRYESDDSTIKSELGHIQVMFSMVDGFVNTYIDAGGSLTDINFKVLSDDGILLNVGTNDNNTRITTTAVGDEIETTMRLPSSEVIWHVIPNIADTSSYKLLIDIRGNSGLMSKAIFSEGFIGREFCEKSLFGTLERTLTQMNVAKDDFEGTGSNGDGLFVCTVYK